MGIVVDIKKQLGDFSLDISFRAENETIALWGPSGSGKSLTLKCIAGIEKPDEGQIVIGDRVVYDSAAGIDLTPQERSAGLLFQDYALFPNMTVRGNLEIVNRKGRDVREFLERFKISSIEKLYPHQLSGGQKQRTAMARMLITDPDVIMLDEPFSALDLALKAELRSEVAGIISELDKPAIIVSHDVDEVHFFTEKMISLQAAD